MIARIALLIGGLAVALAACERKATPPPPPKDTPQIVAARPAPPWFVCDAINAPTVLVVSRPDPHGEATALAIDKADLHPPVARLYEVGLPQTVDGARTWTLSHEGAAVGQVRALNPARLERPADALTDPIVEVKTDDADLSCRWLARTRLFGVAAGRTVLVTEEDGGPLLRTFDFKAGTGGRVLPDGVQRSSQPTLRIAGGRREADAWIFANAGYGYVVDVDAFAVTEGGRATAREPFIALQRDGD